VVVRRRIKLFPASVNVELATDRTIAVASVLIFDEVLSGITWLSRVGGCIG
jgi:hypothetical protein